MSLNLFKPQLSVFCRFIIKTCLSFFNIALHNCYSSGFLHEKKAVLHNVSYLLLINVLILTLFVNNTHTA